MNFHSAKNSLPPTAHRGVTPPNILKYCSYQQGMKGVQGISGQKGVKGRRGPPVSCTFFLYVTAC